MIRIARPNKKQPSRQSALDRLAAAEKKVKLGLEEGLEEAFEEEAAAIAAFYPSVRRAGRVSRAFEYKGFRVNVWVPRLRLKDGTVRLTPLFEELSTEKEQRILELRKKGISSRHIATIMFAFNGENVSGTARSSVSRLDIETGDAAIEELENRRFDKEPIVAVMIDGTAIGTPNKKRQVMIAVGVTADGRRLVLGTSVVDTESEAQIKPLVRQILENGVSPNALFVADQGAGIRAALRACGVTNIAKCTTHAARNATTDLPNEILEEIRLDLYAAWAEDSAEDALAKLKLVEAKLRLLEFEAQANSLKESMEGTVVTQRLGLKGELRSQLRSTNPLESVNGSVKAALPDVTLWKDDEMRLRWVTRTLLDLEAESWQRLADPKGLVELMETLGLTGHDAEAIRAGLPPSLSVTKTPMPVEDVSYAEKLSTKWLAEAPDASWFGAPGALSRFGTTPGSAVQPEALSRAMRGLHATSGQVARESSNVKLVVRGPDDRLERQLVPGLKNLEWELTASPGLMSSWKEAGADQRAVLESGMMDAAMAAVEQATNTTQSGHGFASTAAFLRPSPDAPPSQDYLRIKGIAVGLVRGTSARVYSPARQESLAVAARAGEDAAKTVLDAALARAAALGGEMVVGPPEKPSAALLAVVDERAMEKAPRMAGRRGRELAKAAAGERDARAGLGIAAAESSAWWEAHRVAGARQIASTWLKEGVPADRDLWFPLGRGARAVLGEKRAQQLCAEAARFVGRASKSPELAADLAKFDQKPLELLNEAVQRVERLSEAIAARHERDNRKLLKSARVSTAPPNRSAPTVELFDSQGNPAKRPVVRNQHALARRISQLQRSSAASAAALGKLDQAQLENLARLLGEPWRDLDQHAAFSHGRLEVKREGIFRELLHRKFNIGRNDEIAGRAKDAGTAFAASAGIDDAIAERCEVELETIRKSIDDARSKGRDPEPERFVRENPRAALYDAVYGELQNRELARRALEAAPAAPAQEMPSGIDISA